MVNQRLFLAAFRSYFRHPWLLFLSVLGVSLGVAVVLSIDIAAQSALKSFQNTQQQLTGNATHRITSGTAGIDEEVFIKLKMRFPDLQIDPVIEGYINLKDKTDLRSLRIRGENLISTRQLPISLPEGDSYLGLVNGGWQILAPSSLKDYGRKLEFDIGSKSVVVNVAGYFEVEPSTVGANLLFADISTAQELLKQTRRLTSIELVIPENRVASVDSELKTHFPELILLKAADQLSGQTQMLASFELNLKALSFLALMIGAFLIFNTVSFSVMERRRTWGVFRTLGVTRKELFLLILFEVFIIASLGVSIGLGLGVSLSELLLSKITQTINDLYFVLEGTELAVELPTLFKALAFGFAASFFAAALPAWEASLTPPRLTLARSDIEDRLARFYLRHAWWIGCVFIGFSVFMAISTGSRHVLWILFTSLFMALLGTALITPRLFAFVLTALSFLGRGSVWLKLSVDGLRTSLSRTAIALAALMIAISVSLGIEIMVRSFRTLVVNWLNQTLHADIYVSPTRYSTTRYHDTIPPEILLTLRQSPLVSQSASIRHLQIYWNNKPVRLVVLDPVPESTESYPIRKKAFDHAWEKLHAEDRVLISESFSNKNKVSTGDRIPLTTPHGQKPFLVSAVYSDYGSEEGLIVMLRTTYNRHWRDPQITTLSLYLKDPTTLNETLAHFESEFPQGRVNFQSQNRLLDGSLKVFDRTFTITQVLRSLAVLIAFTGVLSALLTLQWSRSRDVAVLRALGLTPWQVFFMTLTQNCIIGGTAGLIALPVGYGVAWFLGDTLNVRSFGWSIPPQAELSVFAVSLALALVTSLLAGLYPSLRLMMIPPSEALREEVS